MEGRGEEGEWGDRVEQEEKCVETVKRVCHDEHKTGIVVDGGWVCSNVGCRKKWMGVGPGKEST